MIKITSVEITDFGRHRKIDSKIKGFGVGLSGPNGRGKSTVLQAIQFALTGTIDHPDPLRAFIRSSSENSPNSAEVTLEFEADGKVGKIQRRITRTAVTRKLWWDGADKPLTSDAAVNEVLFNILGVDKKAINSTVFIRQGEMASMFGGDVDRRDFYIRLLMLGHLSKVANTVETYRESVAGSVQDLGAVRDAAASVYEKAHAYLETCDAALASKPSVVDELVIARKVVAYYDELASARVASDHAVEALRQRLPEKADPTMWLETSREQLEGLRAKIGIFNAKRTTNLTASSAFHALQSRLQRQEFLRETLDQAVSVEAQLKAIGQLEQDPSEEIRLCESRLTKFARAESLDEALPKMQKDEAEAASKVNDNQVLMTSIQEAYQAGRELYAVTKGGLDMRTNLLSNLQASGNVCASGCPLCGGASPPSEAHLQNEIRVYKEQLDELLNKGQETRRLLDESKLTQANFVAAHRAAATRLDDAVKERKRLRIELSLTRKETTLATLEAAQRRLGAYHAKLNEHTRLATELSRLSSILAGQQVCSKDEIAIIKSEVQAANDIMQSSPWTDADAAELNNHESLAGQISTNIEQVQQQVADVGSTTRRLDEVTGNLQKAITEAPPGFYSNIRGAAVLTPSEAQQKLATLEAMQQDHDEARGKRMAAHAARMAASREIDELDLRTAEQQHRLRLVKDLELLRDTFKPNGASLEFVDHKFSRIAQLAGDYLAESGADFMVAASEDAPLSFVFLRTDRANEVWMPQNRMSGGQKVRLAVATLRAIHALVMPNVGLLVLDEPTTHLDEEAKRSMADMLRKIGDECTLQMIVCDHSPTLIDAFSDRIEIPD